MIMLLKGRGSSTNIKNRFIDRMLVCDDLSRDLDVPCCLLKLSVLGFVYERDRTFG